MFISTNAFDALHDIEEGGIQFAKLNPDSQVSAFYVGLKDRGGVFSVRRQIDALPNAGLMGVMPGVALDDLWSTMEVATSMVDHKSSRATPGMTPIRPALGKASI